MWEFSTSGKIIFGEGTIGKLPSLSQNHGKKALIVTGSTPQRVERFTKSLSVEFFPVTGEPTVQLVKEGVNLAKEFSSDHIIAIGGGSVIDCGKAIAAMVANPGDIFDYLEVIGKGKSLEIAPLPFIAVPTTAGTGAEVTRNAVLSVPEQNVKVSLRSPLMLPDIALLDPELTYGLPKEITAESGLDAITQLIEPFLSIKNNPMTDCFCREGLTRAASSLGIAFTDGKDKVARSNLLLVSLFGGLALANAGLGVVHGFAGPIGGMFSAPHGAICARILPEALKVNYRAVCRQSNSIFTRRFQELGTLLTGSLSSSENDLLSFISDLVDFLKIPPLSKFGISKTDFPEIIEKAKVSSSMKGNPVALSDEELHEILSSSM
ncbi:MAG: iron-containing alcohol dehydrogenase [Candidatus Riflebacteria bacterium]|nr:iron-containing alcohol dehydrogenase [Candidatus Riflebacteria bacterium]